MSALHNDLLLCLETSSPINSTGPITWRPERACLQQGLR
jgi:hypothetical protein